ncbi:MAG: hypothetical protein ACXVCT_22625 [Ktedonobacterales bacterium]
MTPAQRTILLTGVASGVTGLVATVTFLFAPLRTIYVASAGFTGPQQVSILEWSGLGAQLGGSIVLCLLLLLGIVAGAMWQVHSQITGGAVLLWTSTVLLGLVISDNNILIAPLDAFLLPSMALALVSSFTTLRAGFVGQPNLQ